MSKKVYLASGWFNASQLNDQIHLKKILESLSFKIFDPRLDNPYQDFTINKNQTKCFIENAKQIDKCDFVVAILTYNDKGTIWEIGYAYAKNKPIMIIDTDINHKPNLMLIKCCKYGWCQSWLDVNSKLFAISFNLEDQLNNEYIGEIE